LLFQSAKKDYTMRLKQILLVIGISAVTAITSVWIYGKAIRKQTAFSQSTDGKVPANYAGFFDGNTGGINNAIDFTKASSAAVPAVVHIKTRIPAKKVSNQIPRGGGGMDEFFERFFGEDMGGMFGPQMQPEQRASGSGVIISEDGYIVTNNHVISDGGQGVADEITVTLHNKKTYKAKVIGKDASSDLAVLKIDAAGLPFLLYGNSEALKLGQWVLAIGYPLNLETTVTAGIVSAKGRSIGINRRQSETPVESFIQTDAAINSGNSGGALINTDGQLIGINAAINGGYTGTYIGYGYAIPVNLVKKVVNDLIQYGDVKRGFIGISYPNTESENERLVKQAGQEDGLGVYISAVNPGGAAAGSGLKKGDVVTKVNNQPVTTGAEMVAQVASYKPGDKLIITYLRSGKEQQVNVTLKGDAGDINASTINNLSEILGAELVNIDSKTANANNVEGGVRVKEITKGGPLSKTRMEKDFIITSVNGMEIKSIAEMSKVMANTDGSNITLDGFYEGYEGMYRYPVKL
jgi:serine protease Do